MTPLLRLTAGAGAGIVAMSATYPLDMVRILKQGLVPGQETGHSSEFRFECGLGLAEGPNAYSMPQSGHTATACLQSMWT